MGNVFISPNLKKTSERIDPSGNIINPRTKEIIQPVIAEYVEPTQTVQPSPEPLKAPTNDLKSIKSQIEQKKAELAELEELKQAKIEQMKAELAELES